MVSWNLRWLHRIVHFPRWISRIKTSTQNFPKTLLRLPRDFHWPVRLYACHIPNNYHLAIGRNTPLLCWVTALPEAAVFLPRDYFATFLGAKTVICGNNAWRSGLQWSGGLKRFSQGFRTRWCRPHKVDGIWHLLMCVCFWGNPKANVAVLLTQWIKCLVNQIDLFYAAIWKKSP